MSTETASPAQAGQGAATTTETTSAATTDTSTETTTSPPPAPPPPPDPFYKSLKNDDMRGWLELKGFKQADPGELVEAVATSYRQLEKLRGVPQERLLTLPENTDDAEAMKPIYEKLGFVAPEKPDDYGFVQMQGADPQFAKAAEEAMHKIGLPDKYAKPIAEWWNAYAAEHEGALLREAEEAAAAELAQVKNEWGAKYEEKLEKGRRAARHLGFSQEELEAIETATGAGNLYRRLEAAYDKLGLSESNFVDSDKAKGGGFNLTPEAAKVRIEELKTNKEWANRYLSGDKACIAEMRRLQEIAHPGFKQD